MARFEYALRRATAQNLNDGPQAGGMVPSPDLTPFLRTLEDRCLPNQDDPNHRFPAVSITERDRVLSQ